ncbi:MAG: hypothetical protein AABZ23_03590, partial [Deltaproteobacteria bacterium]
MNGSYSRDRLNTLDALLQKKPDALSGGPWTLEPRSLRFKHGENLAELKIPYHMGADDEACIEGAVSGLAGLIKKRYENLPDAQKKVAPPVGRINLGAATVEQPLKQKSFRTDIFIADSLEKRLASDILSSTTAVDASIIYAWLGPESQGRTLVKWLSSLIEKAMKDEAKNGFVEQTAYLALMAAISTARRKKEGLKELRIKGIPYEKIDFTVGIALFYAFRAALSEVLRRLKDSSASCYSASGALILSSVPVPRSFISIQATLLSMNANPYSINSEVFEALSRVLPGFDEKASGTEALLNAAASRLKDSPEALEVVRQQYGISRFRQEAINHLMEFDAPGAEAHAMLYDLYAEDRLIKNFLSDPRMPLSLSRAFDELKKTYARDSRMVDAISSFQRHISGYKKTLLGSLLKGPKAEEADHVTPAVEGYYACRFDDLVERHSGMMRGYLADRRTEFDQKALVDEYNRGRLYRFSTDERPIIKTLSIEEEGQLFIDMKDFTRKTLKIKEIAMADFMKEQFYKPILSAAGKYSAGAGLTEEADQGILLTNLLGDAAIFSGGVKNLVSLAKDIQFIINRYRDQLMQKLPPRKSEEVLAEVHRRFEARRAELKGKRAELEIARQRGEQGTEVKLLAVGEEEHRLENTYRDELENAIKGELEAGLFISYGARAEVLSVESDETNPWKAKVAIAEKINEAARGTYRNSLIRARLEVLLERAKNAARNENLRYPFDIYIDRAYSLKMPPELDEVFERLFTSRNRSHAAAMAKLMSEEYLLDLEKIVSGEPFSSLRLIATSTDIYNKGQALSSDALMAYIRDSKGVKTFFQKTTAVQSIDPGLRDSFFFPFEALDFWIGFEVV